MFHSLEPKLLLRCNLTASKSERKPCCAGTKQLSPLERLLEDFQEVAGQILSHLSLRNFAVLRAASKSACAALKHQPEHAWLAPHLPPHHPLRQAPCARAVLDEQRTVQSNFATDRFSGSVSVPGGKVSSSWMPAVCEPA